MSNTPDISVVMGVYNGAPHLRETIDSINSQEDVSLEFIIVDDGSTDGTAQILEEYASRHPHIHIIRQDNQGLTSALIRGCGEAKGRFVARQDAGDISLPGRLRKQLAFINEHPDASIVSCGTRFVGPNGEPLYDVVLEPDQAQSGLLSLSLAAIRGPAHHGSTLFPRSLYERVGGYRSCFYFAQDLDLWIRLAEQGTHFALPDILYQAAVTVSAISGLYRKEQVDTAAMILESADLRRRGMSDAPALQKARTIRPTPRQQQSRRERARALYFIGMCLKKRRSPQASGYFRKALRVYPFHLRSVARLLLG